MEQAQWIGEYLFTRKDTRYRDLSTVRSHEGRAVYTSNEPGDCLRYIRGRSSIAYVLHDPAGRQGEEGYYTLDAALERLMACEDFDGFALAAEIAGSRVNLCYRHTGGQYILSGMHRYVEYRPHKLLQMQILPAVVKWLEPNLSRGPQSAEEPIYPFNYHLLRLHDSAHLLPFKGKTYEEVTAMGYTPSMDDYRLVASKNVASSTKFDDVFKLAAPTLRIGDIAVAQLDTDSLAAFVNGYDRNLFIELPDDFMQFTNVELTTKLLAEQYKKDSSQRPRRPSLDFFEPDR